jgi:hypothetical protein
MQNLFKTIHSSTDAKQATETSISKPITMEIDQWEVVGTPESSVTKDNKDAAKNSQESTLLPNAPMKMESSSQTRKDLLLSVERYQIQNSRLRQEKKKADEQLFTVHVCLFLFSFMLLYIYVSLHLCFSTFMPLYIYLTYIITWIVCCVNG